MFFLKKLLVFVVLFERYSQWTIFLFLFVCLFVLMKPFGKVTHHSVIFFFFETRKPEVLKISFSFCIYVYKLMTGS